MRYGSMEEARRNANAAWEQFHGEKFLAYRCDDCGFYHTANRMKFKKSNNRDYLLVKAEKQGRKIAQDELAALRAHAEEQGKQIAAAKRLQAEKEEENRELRQRVEDLQDAARVGAQMVAAVAAVQERIKQRRKLRKLKKQNARRQQN